MKKETNIFEGIYHSYLNKFKNLEKRFYYLGLYFTFSYNLKINV